jgi:hypothetical protein
MMVAPPPIFALLSTVSSRPIAVLLVPLLEVMPPRAFLTYVPSVVVSTVGIPVAMVAVVVVMLIIGSLQA